MRYPAHIYARALAEVVETTKPEDTDLVVRNFLDMVRKNGDEIHLEKILEETARFARKNGGIRKIVVESARELSSRNRKEIAGFTKPGDVMVENINPELIAGIRVVINDELQLDGTLKGKLDKVFENIQK
jgi:F0F1-type ATP synthase delta subunit